MYELIELLPGISPDLAYTNDFWFYCSTWKQVILLKGLQHDNNKRICLETTFTPKTMGEALCICNRALIDYYTENGFL